MTLPETNEKDRFLFILGQARYELMDGVRIPYVERKFTDEEYAYITGVCAYIEKMIDLFDRKGQLKTCPVTCGECKYGTQLFPGKITCTSVMMDQDNTPEDYCSFGRRADDDERAAGKDQ